jgi:hypothetical protein
MTSWSLLCVPLLLGPLSCTVTAVSGKEDARPTNTCSSSSACGTGESCLDGLCQSLNGELEAVLLTATPAVESGVTQLTFVSRLAELPASGASKDVVWPGVASVTGSLFLPDGHCYPDFISEVENVDILASKDGTLPVTVTLSLRERLLDLGQQTYYGKTINAPLMGYSFVVKVPSGEYDVYLVPPKRQKGTCVVPPQLFRGVPIGVAENSAPNGVYRFNLAAVSELNLHLLWPDSGASLTGFTADIIEPLGGNPISTEVQLGNPSPGRAGKLDYAIPLAYSAVTDRASTGDDSASAARELLRLRPPAGAVAPTIYFERSALGVLQKPGQPVNVSVFTRFPDPVTVQGMLVKQEDGESVPGTVTLVSKSIYGVDPGVFGSYQTKVAVGPDGALKVDVPPGRYVVHATPDILPEEEDRPLSSLQAEWDVPADVPVQFGKLLELSRTAEVTGMARVQGAQVRADPSPRTVLPFEKAFGSEPFTPRSTGSFVDEAGRFALNVDELPQSRVNVSVQPPEELGFAWFVRPGLQLGRGNQDLGRVNLPLPVALSGEASVQDGDRNVVLGSALIRAYAYLDKDFEYTRDPSEAESIVPVAETRADPEGNFQLLLPSTIGASK